MAKKKHSGMEKGLALSGAILGLLMGGSALASSGATPGHEYFQFKDLKSGYQLAQAEEPAGEEEAAEGEGEGEGEEEKEKGEMGEGEKSCGEGSCG